MNFVILAWFLGAVDGYFINFESDDSVCENFVFEALGRLLFLCDRYYEKNIFL